MSPPLPTQAQRRRIDSDRRSAGSFMIPAAVLLLVVLPTALVLTGCEPPPLRRPNIIFLTVDTLRADHMSLYGYERDTMPSMEAFAETGVVFDNAVVPRGATRPSYASMVTGLYPYRHGVRDQHTRLHGDLDTLAEILQEEGYRTAGFVGNFVLVGELSGMDQGFDVYDDLVEEQEVEGVNYERSASGTLAAVLDWLDRLEQEPDQPFFLFTNFMDPHGPYLPPAHLAGLFRSDRVQVLEAGQIPDYQKVGQERNLYDYVDRYDAEIRYVDSALGILMAELEARGHLDQALVVFTADHGESLGEHGVYFEHHWNLYEETNRVPLVIRPPAGWPRPVREDRVRTVVSPMDLVPTVLELVGREVPEDLDGRSLLAYLEGQEDPRRILFLEYPNVESPEGHVPDWWSARAAEWSLIRIAEDTSGEVLMQALFDLERDPYQQEPIPPNPTLGAWRALEGALDGFTRREREHELGFQVTRYVLPMEDREEWKDRRRQEAGVEVRTLDPEQVEKLRSLGYAD